MHQTKRLPQKPCSKARRWRGPVRTTGSGPVGVFHRSGREDDYAIASTFPPGQPSPIRLPTDPPAHSDVGVGGEPIADVASEGAGWNVLLGP